MKSRFQPDADAAPGPAPTLIDPEAFDVSEQQFAASLEEKLVLPPRFEVEHAESPASSAQPSQESLASGADTNGAAAQDAPAGEPDAQKDAAVAIEDLCPPPDSWRREVAARVNQYRGKRPRAPRYPSLQLSFDGGWPAMIAPPAGNQLTATPTRGQLAITMDFEPSPATEPQPAQDIATAEPLDGATNILAFPRSPFMPPAVEELAEPVFDRPRILEVPEVLPPPPALGGISIEPSEPPPDQRRPGFELPLKPAPLSRRILGGMTDALVVAAAFSVFAYICYRITAVVPPLSRAVEVGAALFAAFWAGYQYLLLVYTGSTPGLKLAKLELSRFDGRAVPRRLRRWRVLASVLSGLSLALGYAWCFMDEDELCWHDRITHTYMAPKSVKPLPASTGH